MSKHLPYLPTSTFITQFEQTKTYAPLSRHRAYSVKSQSRPQRRVNTTNIPNIKTPDKIAIPNPDMYITKVINAEEIMRKHRQMHTYQQELRRQIVEQSKSRQKDYFPLDKTEPIMQNESSAEKAYSIHYECPPKSRSKATMQHSSFITEDTGYKAPRSTYSNLTNISQLRHHIEEQDHQFQCNISWFSSHHSEMKDIYQQLMRKISTTKHQINTSFHNYTQHQPNPNLDTYDTSTYEL